MKTIMSQQIYRYRTEDGGSWNVGNFDDFTKWFNQFQTPSVKFQIRMFCDHSIRHIENGIEYCDICKDTIRITSHRD